MGSFRHARLQGLLAGCLLALAPAATPQGQYVSPGSSPGIAGRAHVADEPIPWRQFRAGAAHTGFNSHETQLDAGNASELVLLWKRQLGSTGLGDGVLAPPSVLHGVVYVNTLGGKLYALDAESGATLWSATTGGYGDSAPAIFDGLVLVGAVTGLQAWPADCGGACVPDWTAGTTTVNPSLTVADGRVFASEYSGYLRAYDLATGAALWGAKVNGADPIFGSPTVADGLVFVPGDLGLYAFAADGSSGSQPLWLRPTQYGCEKSPAAADGRVFIADDGGRVYAMDAASGALLWTALTSFQASSPALADGRVFVTTGDAQVFAFPAEATGHPAPLWTTSLGLGKALFDPVVANGVVWAGSIDNLYTHGTLYAFEADTGEQVAALSVDGAIESGPVVVDGRVYLSTLAGLVYAFELP